VKQQKLYQKKTIMPLPPGFVFRGRIVNSDGAALSISYTLIASANARDSNARRASQTILNVTGQSDLQKTALKKSVCCECEKEFAKGDDVCKTGGKTFCPGELTCCSSGSCLGLIWILSGPYLSCLFVLNPF
jgi:hypothetical protein